MSEREARGEDGRPRRGEFRVVAAKAEPTRCRWCPAQVVFARHRGTGSRMVLDWRSRRDGGVDGFGRRLLAMVSHFATCPRANEVRKAEDLKRALARRRAERRAGVQDLPFPAPEHVPSGDDPG